MRAVSICRCVAMNSELSALFRNTRQSSVGGAGVPYETYPLDLVPPGPNYIYNYVPPRSRLYYIECTPGGTFYLDNKYPFI